MSKKHSLTAIITDKRGRILSIGQNSYTKTHTLQASIAKSLGLPDKIFQHAEINAIVKCKDLSKAHKISVFRYGADGKPRSAKPCIICMSAISETDIEHIEWTTDS